MVYELELHDFFWRDVRQAVAYYESISPALSARFSDILLEILKKLQGNPENYFNISKKYRRVRLIIFPYQIIYSFKNNTVKVVQLKHENSRSRDYMKRGKSLNI